MGTVDSDLEHRTSDETKQIVRFVTETRNSEVPDGVLHQSKRCLLDFLGLTIAAAEEPAVTISREQCLRLGGNPQASALGSRVKLRVSDAALVNGIAGHVFDFDDTHVPTILHPTTPLYAAGMALAEWRGNSGTDLLASHALGYELAARASMALYPEHYDEGWHMTATTGCLAGYGASARLLGLGEEAALRGLSLAATQAGGHREQFGTMAKPFHAGRAASAGVISALFAEAGFTAAPDPLQGRRAMFSVMSSSHSAQDLVDGLGERWEIFNNGVKPYACGVVIHPAADAMKTLRSGISVEQIDEVTIRVHPLVLELTGRTQPRTGLEGKFSVKFVCAMVLLEGKASEQQFSDVNVQRPDIVSLMQRITLLPEEGMNHSEASASVLMQDGETFDCEIKHASGTPGNPLSDSALSDKFHQLVDPLLGEAQANELERHVWTVDQAEHLGPLLESTLPAKG